MFRKLITIISIILIASGICIMLFPTISNTIGNQITNSLIEQFDKAVKNVIDDEKDKGIADSSDNREIDSPVFSKIDLDSLYQDSVAYNNNLKNNQKSLLTNNYSYVTPSINLNDYGVYNGMYGYISAPSIGMKLPIYLGANNSTMSYGAAHLTYTSLPLGGEDTNCVIAGHTGYLGRIFFDNIRNLSIGDTIELTNYWYTIKYKVIDTQIYKSNEVQAIFISPGKDLLTLLTCISDGYGGFNRYFVICERS